MIFTTSWDDGYATDLRIAEMLTKHGATGTFYICPAPQHDQPMLSLADIKQLGLHHEVGAHTLTHPKLSKISLDVARQEIRSSKSWIEEVTEKPCTMFCYPYGDLNDSVRREVESAGFEGARTVEDLQFEAKNRFMMPTSLQVAPFPWRRKFTRTSHLIDPLGPLRAKWNRLTELKIPLTARRSWQALARALFLQAQETHQQFFHLWGHAFELEKYGLWDELDSFLAFVSTHSVEHRTNGQLVRALFP